MKYKKRRQGTVPEVVFIRDKSVPDEEVLRLLERCYFEIFDQAWENFKKLRKSKE